jgi:poly(3-hydroxyalkanoate) depolymerase
MAETQPHFQDVTVGSNVLRAAVWKHKGSRPPLLFFNGIGANIEVIAPFAEALTDRDVITFDPPGVGGSGTALYPYRPWQLARMAAAVLDALGYQGKVDVMGVSWGGAMAQQFAFQFSSRVRRLILCATAAGVLMVPGHPKALLKLAHPRRYMDPEYMMKHFEMLYGDSTADAPDHSSRLRPPSLLGYFYQLVAGAGWTSVPFLPFMKQPTLVLAGDNDQIVPVVNGRFLTRLIPNARLEVVKGGHLFLISRADEVIPLIRDFLNNAEAVAPAPQKARSRSRSALA